MDEKSSDSYDVNQDLARSSSKKTQSRRKTTDNKKLVKLSRMCKEIVQDLKDTNGTEIANLIIERSKRNNEEVEDFKNVQRRIYDALNVLNALGIVEKYRNIIN